MASLEETHFGYINMKPKPSSPTLSSFTPSKILPYHDTFFSLAGNGATVYGKADSAIETGADAPVDKQIESRKDKTTRHFSTDDLSAYDLRPPPPNVSHDNAEFLAGRLFSVDHLKIVLEDHGYFQRFRGFLNRYRPQLVPTLVKYLASQKALTAIRYANALVDQLGPQKRHRSKSSPSHDVATIDGQFETFSKGLLEELVTEALPAYITFRMVTTVTEFLVREITGASMPVMRDLVNGLAEVYCMSDPHQPDCPIVFASDEFYRTTQYGRDWTIGKNCRFLQGPETSKATVKRISSAVANNEDISEIILNYRRDGSPFLNLVMMAPLMDHHGATRYYIGAQVDISVLLEGGRGLESFKQLLDQDEHRTENHVNHKPSLKLLRELSGLLNDEELEVVSHREGRRNSIESSASAGHTPTRSGPNPHRRFVGMEESTEDLWPSPIFGPSGRLPGVYQNYLLVRPYPSLRIIFTSAALRIPGLSQSKLMDRIGGPQHVREGIVDALSQGIGVTAKVAWLPHAPRHESYAPLRDDSSINTTDPENFKESRPRWIHCTPLMGADSQPGVIMIVMVDKEEITGTLNTQKGHTRHVQIQRPADYTKEGWPLGSGAVNGSLTPKSNGNNLYAEYMKRSRSASQPPTGRFPLHAGEERTGGNSAMGIASVRSPSIGSKRSTGSWSTSQWAGIGGREDSEEEPRYKGRNGKDQ